MTLLPFVAGATTAAANAAGRFWQWCAEDAARAKSFEDAAAMARDLIRKNTEWHEQEMCAHSTKMTELLRNAIEGR